MVVRCPAGSFCSDLSSWLGASGWTIVTPFHRRSGVYLYFRRLAMKPRPKSAAPVRNIGAGSGISGIVDAVSTS